MRIFSGFIFFLLIILSFSCRSKHPDIYIGIPADSVIDRETMIQMLTDLHVLEATLQMERSRGVDATKLSPRYYAAFFSKYKVSEKRFLGSIDYYKQDQQTFIRIYDVVIDSLKSRSEHLSAPKEKQPE
jgi:hypothetical protein